jgi:hypothetical protein
MTSKNSAPSSSVRASDLLCSGNDGVYDVSFFAASIRHSIGQSQSVFGKLSGDSLAAFGEDWKMLSDSDQQAFLLEHHEFAHHALMFSTPAGVLNWRMNQVISRDVQWILRKCHEYGVQFAENTAPRDLLASRAWQVAFKRRADVARGTKRELLRTIEGLEDILRLRRILFEPGAATVFVDLTFGEMQGLIRRSFAYLEHRCDVPLRKDWRTTLPLSTKVFPEGRDFNLVDIAEVHAIAMELFVLRALGDFDGLDARIERARQGSYGLAFAIAVDATKAANDLGLSPHQMQLLSLVSFASALDVAGVETGPVYLEEALPWWRFALGAALTAQTYVDALKNCLALVLNPLVGTGSRWLQLADVGFWTSPSTLSLERIGAMSMTLASLGLDRQIHAIHEGARLNFRYLASQLEVSFDGRIEDDFERLSPETWRGKLQSSVLLVEYKDGLHFRHADFDALYPKGNPHRASLKHLDDYAPAAVQIMGQILNGALPRISYAAYAGCLIPRLDILEPKLAAYLGNPALAASTIELLTLFLEGGASPNERYLTLAPKTVPLERYI